MKEEIVTREFTEQADKYSEIYNIRYQDAYQMLTMISIQHGVIYLGERIFHPNKYYTNVYRIAEEKILSQKQSKLERISNEDIPATYKK